MMGWVFRLVLAVFFPGLFAAGVIRAQAPQPAPCDEPRLFVHEVLVTPSIAAPPGCGVTAAQIGGDWITGTLANGNDYTDASIVPSEGLRIMPDFGGAAPLSQSWSLNHGANATNRFFDNPTDIANSPGILNKVGSTGGFYDWQAGDIFEADINDTMCVAFFYAINPEATVKTLQMGFGSDDGGGVRVNGKPAHLIQACRGHPGFADKFGVNLKPGKNLISFYTFEQGGGYNACIRFEEPGTGVPVAVLTTVDPAGYTYDPNAPDPPSPPFVAAVLVTPSIDAPPGCGVTPDQIGGDWITGTLENGNAYTDASIVPQEGMKIRPDFLGGAPLSNGWALNHGPSAAERFFTDPNDVANSFGILNKATSTNGFYDWQRGDIFEGDINNTMCVAFFYAVNPEGANKTLQMGFGSDDGGGVRVNGKNVHRIQACRGDPGFADKYLVVLKPGKNLVSFTTFEQGGGYNARIRFEEIGTGVPLSVQTTLDPAGYVYDPNAPEPPPAPINYVPEVLVTPSIDAPPGCGVTGAQIDGDWITGADGNGNAYTDATIVPQEGMQIRPDFAGDAPLSVGWSLNHGPDAAARFFTDPADIAGSFGILNKATSTNGFYDWQRGDIFEADINNTMCVAFFYAINNEATVKTLQMGFGSDDGGGVRVNGKSAHRIQACRGHPGFADKFGVNLKPGKNLVSFTTFEQGGGYNACIRFEDPATGAPLAYPTTLDPTGYVYDPNAPDHPPPAPPAYVPAVLVTPSIIALPGCGVTPPQIGGDWITGFDSEANEYTDANIVPFEGMQIFPAFGTQAPLSQGWSESHGPNAQTRYFSDPGDLANSFGILNKVTSGNGFYDWQRGDIFEADINNTMCVAFFYAINEEATNRTLQIGFGSDDGGGVRVNGKNAHRMQACRGHPGFADKFPVVLKPGKNLVSFTTFEQGGGYTACIRFENPATGAPLAIPTTLDPAGYTFDPDPPQPPGPGNPTASGIVTRFLVPENPLDQGIGCATRSLTIPDDYLSIGGAAPSHGNVREGAIVAAGSSANPITTSVRSPEGTTTLVVFDGATDPAGLGAADPGLFNGEFFYAGQGGPDNYTGNLFFFIGNLTDQQKTVYLGFASDDAASLFFNGQLIGEHLGCRGFGGANAIQNGYFPADLAPKSSNLVQISYNEGGGGSGARVGVFNNCAGSKFIKPNEVAVDVKPVGVAVNTWVRADTNGDRIVDISDAIGILGHLFVGAATPECLIAAELFPDGSLDITDGVNLLGVLFLGQPPPPLFRTCESFAGCRPNCP